MGALVFSLRLLHLNDWLTLPLQVLTGVAAYVVLSVLLRLDSFCYVLEIVKRVLGRRAGKERAE